MRSIRKTLVWRLVGGLALGSLAVLAGTYLLTRHQVGRMFDDELRQVALAVHVREDWMQTQRVRIARPGFEVSVRAYDAKGRLFFETLLPALPPSCAIRPSISWRLYFWSVPVTTTVLPTSGPLAGAFTSSVSFRPSSFNS